MTRDGARPNAPAPKHSTPKPVRPHGYVPQAPRPGSSASASAKPAQERTYGGRPAHGAPRPFASKRAANAGHSAHAERGERTERAGHRAHVERAQRGGQNVPEDFSELVRFSEQAAAMTRSAAAPNTAKSVPAVPASASPAWASPATAGPRVTSFSELDLIEPIQRAVAAEKYTTPTPIQSQAIPHLLLGRDLLGCAQTGTGKTAAFALPMLQYLALNPRGARPRCPRTLILTPTRELAAQICDSFGVYGRYLKVSRTVVFGGVGQVPQIQALSRGLDVLVATPGRLLDLVTQRRCDLSQVEIFVLDEADRMLDMGFLPDIRRIISTLPDDRQTLFFSATMPQEIAGLASSLLSNPVKVHVTPERPTAEHIDQKVLYVRQEDKANLLNDLLKDETIGRALVFTRTKHGANKVVKKLLAFQVSAEAIHGNKSQAARTQALAKFRSGRCRVLVATDIAARGIDVDGITHVINYDLPNEPESYVHRIGRTARAGASGIAYSFCAYDERPYLRDIERLIRKSVPVHRDHAYDAG